MAKTVADQFAETLAAAGVRRIYGVVGDSLNGLTDSLRRQAKIQWLHVRHEEVAAFAAGAEAHLTGELAVCAGSCGPGNLHLINGLFDCHRSRVPALAIAAQIPSPEIGAGYFQETHPQTLFKECSHYCEFVSESQQLPRILEIAIREAVGKRGVAVVVLPGDVALEPASDAPLAKIGGLLPPRPLVAPADAELKSLAALLNGDDTVTILCGSGCEGAHEELLALGKKLKAPMVHALRGKEHVEWDNPYDVGMTGLIGFSSGYYAMLDCDILLMLGTDFPYRQFYPRGSGVRIAHVDIRPENIGKRTPVDLGVVGDVKATIIALLPLLKEKSDDSHLAQARKHYAKARKSLDDLALGTGKRVLHPQQVAKAISDHASADAVFTCDVGLPTVWAARYLAMNGKRRLIGSFWHGSMANAMAQAIGAQAAFPGRQVISLSGDGGFSMLMGDFLTSHAASASGEDRGLQQRQARLRGARADVDRLSDHRHRSREPKLRRHGGSHRRARHQDRETGRGGCRHHRSASPRRSRTGRCGGRAHRACDAAGDHRRDGERLYALYGQSGVQWENRRDH